MSGISLTSADDEFLGGHHVEYVKGGPGPGNDYIESSPLRSDFDREIGLTRIAKIIEGSGGDDTLLSRDGYHLIVGGEGCDHYIIEPTHEVSDHHFEEGCTII